MTSLWSRVSGYVRRIDQFGHRIELRLHRKKEFKTTLGGWFTILLFLVTIYVAIVFLQEMVSHSNPSTQFKEEMWSESFTPSIVPLFRFALGFLDENQEIVSLDEQIDGVNSFRITVKGLEYVMIKCNSSASQSVFKPVVDWSDTYTNGLYCLSKENLDTIDVGDLYRQKAFEVRGSMRDSRVKSIVLISQESVFDPTNFNEPFKFYQKRTITKITGNLIHMQMGISMKRLISTIGYLRAESLSEDSFVNGDLTIIDSGVSSRDASSDISVQIHFSLPSKILTYTRNYIKIFDTLAAIGGFIQSQMICYQFLTRPFTKLALHTTVLNDLFSFDSESHHSTSSKKKQLTSSKGGPPSPDHSENNQKENERITQILNNHLKKGVRISKEEKPTAESKEEENIFRKFMRIGTNTLSITCVDHLRNLLNCWCRRKKGAMIKASKKRVNERLDIVYILKKLVEIDKLKMILLSDQQRRLFDYLPKPLVSTSSHSAASSSTRSRNSLASGIHTTCPSSVVRNSEQYNMRNEWTLLNSEQSTLHKAIHAVQAFQNIMNSDDREPLSIIDLKLIEMLDPQIVSRFCAIHLDSISEFNNKDIEDASESKKHLRNSHSNNNTIHELDQNITTNNINNNNNNPSNNVTFQLGNIQSHELQLRQEEADAQNEGSLEEKRRRSSSTAKRAMKKNIQITNQKTKKHLKCTQLLESINLDLNLSQNLAQTLALFKDSVQSDRQQQQKQQQIHQQQQQMNKQQAIFGSSKLQIISQYLSQREMLSSEYLASSHEMNQTPQFESNSKIMIAKIRDPQTSLRYISTQPLSGKKNRSKEIKPLFSVKEGCAEAKEEESSSNGGEYLDDIPIQRIRENSIGESLLSSKIKHNRNQQSQKQQQQLSFDWVNSKKSIEGIESQTKLSERSTAQLIYPSREFRLQPFDSSPITGRRTLESLIPQKVTCKEVEEDEQQIINVQAFLHSQDEDHQ